MHEDAHEAIAGATSAQVRKRKHTNGIETGRGPHSRDCRRLCHEMSVKHLSRYMDQFRYRWNNHRDHRTKDFKREHIEKTVGRQRLTPRAPVEGDLA